MFNVTGSHTGERIADEYSKVMREYGISNKVAFAVTDNASNMKRAFHTCLPDNQANSQAEAKGDDDDNERKYLDHVDAFSDIDLSRHQRLSCFAHSLQLVVSDALKDSSALKSAMAKVKRVINLVHSSTSVKVGNRLNIVFSTLSKT